MRVVRTCWSPYFYPRSPCGERHGQDVLLPAALEFLSTLSLRRATIGGSTNQTHKINFYPRSPCGERPALKTIKALFDTISIHALLAESDSKEGAMADFDKIFLSTLSLRRATSAPAGKRAGRYYFYPRSPCGERPAYRVQLGSIVSISIHALLAESDHQPRQTSHCKKLFLSTLSLRRATFARLPVMPSADDFYPRSPCGERLTG